MAYMLLIVEPRGQRSTRARQEGEDLYQRMLDYGRSLQARGLLLGGDSLRESAARLSIRGGRQNVVDGPFTNRRSSSAGSSSSIARRVSRR